MAIERGVDDVDIQELEIEDNSKEVEVNVEDESFDELLGSGFEDDDRIYAGILSRSQWPNLDLNLTTQYAFFNKSRCTAFAYG